jgi:FtsP/CotA-like multicopper oxidase with cupredoxin domain
MEVPAMGLSRRSLLLGGGAIAAACCAGGSGLAWLWQAGIVDTRGKVDFTNPLAVPPLAPSARDAEGRRVFELRAGAGRHDFGAGPVSTWGYNGDYLGPTLRATRGEEVLIHVTNDLADTTSLHWHGMHLPAAMDGGPHQPIAPGATWSPTWRVNQPATMLWYHPHPHGRTAEHVYRGLAGAFFIDDPATDVTALPHTYGVDDFPIVVQDKTFDGDELSYRATLLGMGILGDQIVVNGTLAPYLDITTDRVRLRLLNASNARVYDFALADGRPFALVGTDGGLLPQTVATDRIQLAPAERADIVVPLRPGERLVLRSNPPSLGTPLGRFFGGSDAFDVLELRAASTLDPRPDVPARLVDTQRLDPSAATERRTMRLTDQSINNRRMDMGRIDATVARDSTEVWRVTNADGKPHSLHIHDVQFQVVRFNGGPPPAHLSGWKDTIFVRTQDEVDVVMRFADYTDPQTPYMFHCHMLFHEDKGMMGQFVVVEPGQQAAARVPASHHHAS